MYREHPLNLKIPPLAVALIGAGLMWFVSRFISGLEFDVPAKGFFAGAFAAAGLTVSALGFVAFKRVGTTLNPMKPHTSSALVSGGIYKVTRNPMYLGFLLALIGWAVFLVDGVTLLILPMFIAYMNRFQIEPEEKALTATFGSAFLDYMKRVRRWI